MPNPVAVVIDLTDEERQQLRAWSRQPAAAKGLAQRSRIVLLAAEGLKNTEIAEQLGIHRGMAVKWRTRFAANRLAGLVDASRPGRPRTVTDADVKAVVVRTLQTTPEDATHWSTRSMARQVGLTQSAVRRIWRAFGLQPHNQAGPELSNDPQFIDDVRELQGMDRTARTLPGVPERAAHDYERARTSNHYAVTDTGETLGGREAEPTVLTEMLDA